jgi:hypothetical protein
VEVVGEERDNVNIFEGSIAPAVLSRQVVV